MYDADSQLTALCVPAGATPAPSAVLAATGARRIGLASADDVNARTEFAAGLVAPLLLPDDVPLIIDSSLASREVLYTPTGESGTALGIHARDLLTVTGATIASLLTPALVDLDSDLRTLLPPGATSDR
jgi:prolyl-tRNA editing enzyme YbaK/EbsC (Cys-tRNA(Pro) deacylase)